jgi:hypothetical protein
MSLIKEMIELVEIVTKTIERVNALEDKMTRVIKLVHDITEELDHSVKKG